MIKVWRNIWMVSLCYFLRKLNRLSLLPHFFHSLLNPLPSSFYPQVFRKITLHQITNGSLITKVCGCLCHYYSIFSCFLILLITLVFESSLPLTFWTPHTPSTHPTAQCPALSPFWPSSSVPPLQCQCSQQPAFGLWLFSPFFAGTTLYIFMSSTTISMLLTLPSIFPVQISLGVSKP